MSRASPPISYLDTFLPPPLRQNCQRSPTAAEPVSKSSHEGPPSAVEQRASGRLAKPERALIKPHHSILLACYCRLRLTLSPLMHQCCCCKQFRQGDGPFNHAVGPGLRPRSTDAGAERCAGVSARATIRRRDRHPSSAHRSGSRCARKPAAAVCGRGPGGGGVIGGTAI